MPDDQSFRFPQSFRLKSPAEFKRVYDRKRSAADDRLVVYVCENGLSYPRLGLSVSRKVGGAVVRNRYKRLFREAFRLTRHDLPPGIDLVLIPRARSEPPAIDELKASLVKLSTQAARRLTPPNGSRPAPESPDARRPDAPNPPGGTP
jgi:ribonuclease P protein component